MKHNNKTVKTPKTEETKTTWNIARKEKQTHLKQ